MGRGYTLDEVQDIARNLVGKTFGEVDYYDTGSYDKGSFGHIIEESGFGYDINSKSEPDFVDAGIELKVTPYKVNKNGSLSAKERLVLNIINYMDEYKHDFYTSHFWYKNQRLQILWYLYEEGKPKNKLKITHQLLFTFPENDLKIIKKDWEQIIAKIKRGEAHLISEADTMYLGACTKGANSKSLREQPFSNVKAMQRAFCLKTSYMTELVREHIGSKKDIEIFLKSDDSFDDYVNSIVNKYKGKTITELKNVLGVDSAAKNLNSLIINRMFSVKGNLGDTEEFLKANIIPKTIRVQSNNHIKESMSFKAFNFIQLSKEDWDNSYLKNKLLTTKYMFFVFKEEKKDYVFKGIKLWNMPYDVIETDVKKVWEKTKDILLSGNIVNYIDEKGRRITNFPGMSDNKVCHVRPHGRDSFDTFPLPVRDKVTGKDYYTKQCFWLNNSYVEQIIMGLIN